MQFFPVLPDRRALLVAFAIGLWWVSRWRYRWVGAQFLVLLTGVGLVTWQGQAAREHRLPADFTGERVVVQGVVVSPCRMTQRGHRFDLAVSRFVAPRERAWRGRVRVSRYAETRCPKPGEEWRFPVKLRAPRGLVNPAAFDYEKWLFSEGVRATGYVLRNAPPPRQIGDHPWRYPVQRVRAILLQRLHGLLGDLPNAGLIKALALGDKSAIQQAQWKTISATGTNHLLAISGLHIGFVAGIAWLFFQWLWKRSEWLCGRCPASLAGALLSLIPAIGYAALSGFAVPARRALIMLVIPAGVLFFRGRLQPFRLFAAALFLVIAIDPLSVFQPGFWLSFLAVGIILWAFAGHPVAPPSGRRRKWWMLLKVQLWISLGLVPVLLWFYQQAPLVSFVANLIAIPWMGFVVVPMVLCGTLLAGVVPVLASLLFQGADWLLQGLWAVLDRLAVLGDGWMLIASPPLWAAASGFIGIMWLLAPRGVPLRWLGVLGCMPLFFYQPTSPRQGQFELTLLDVGQGLSALVRTATHRLVFDTGPAWSGNFSAAQSILLPFLRSQGGMPLDALVLSHADHDHIGDFQEIIARVRPNHRYSGTPEQLSAVEGAWTHCQGGDAWDWDGVRFVFLTPAMSGRAAANRNNRSCVLLVEGPTGSLLLTGDLEREGEAALLKQYAEYLDVDLLVVPHHGSNTSSSGPFVAATSPDWALVSSGFMNRFGHPAEPVRKRYHAIGSRILNTADWGALQVTSRMGRRYEVKRWREESRPFWRQGPDSPAD